ncbi:TldD/PmbA family protein [Pyrococcus yayanosii]|uniref:Zinc-dependent protease, TldD/PmbA family n=1 Tax=Pyrococcus yayanosii (strain CH1 / JCM 16557) TaxID=529709 RepID=F8AFP7_PYRYC|nr:metallopeptidase TldD-related protein [Pyrococcus yayanosii]AEH25023.1 zinc-dependent protease, TldD/PmbA family [Pyrococcus yayanosii CH1]
MEQEIYRLREERKGVSLEGSFKPFAKVREFTAVRLIENGKMGSALAEGEGEAEAFRLARETLRFSSEEDYRLPTGHKSRWKRAFEIDVGDLAGELSALAGELKGISLSGTVELITRRFSVESTAGADVEGSYSFLRAELEIGGGLSFQVSAGSASKTELIEFIKPYLELIDRLDEIAPPKGKVEVVFAPTPLYTLLLPPVLWKFRGRTVVNSPGMEAKEGKVLASPLVTVLDDPLDEGSLRYVKADDEGVKARKNFLIEKGIAKGLLWDSYTAWKAGKESTGNGIRIEEEVFDGPHNLTLAPGRETLERMIEEVEKGFLALGLRGANALDPVTGNFSVVVTPALIIERGEVKGFSRFELKGNVWELLKTTTGVGSELTRVWLDEGLSLSLPFLRTEVVV